MKTYIGTTVLKATPAWMLIGRDGRTHVILHEPKLLEGETKHAGYRVLYENGNFDWINYIDFQKTFHEAKGLPFGLAIEAAKMGKKIARAGWNGKNQYVELAYCISYKNNAAEVINVNHCNIGNKALAFVGTSGVQMGWLASQADMLADDWYIVE